MAVAPPTVTFFVRVPPSSRVAPNVTVLIAFGAAHTLSTDLS
jgi:hypothetical protein